MRRRAVTGIISAAKPMAGRTYRNVVGCVIEKQFEGGREKLAHLGVPIHTLANIVRMSEQGGVVVEGGR